jgi:hypothetical protein
MQLRSPLGSWFFLVPSEKCSVLFRNRPQMRPLHNAVPSPDSISVYKGK